MRVQLSWSEVIEAALNGVLRHVRALSKQRTPYHRLRDDAWQEDIVGSLGERAVARALDRYPGGTPLLDYDGDVGVGGKLHVRATPYPDGALLLHEADPDAAAFVLVTGVPPAFEVRGWILGRDGKRREWWRTTVRRPCYFVPQAALRDLAELCGTPPPVTMTEQET